MDAAEYKHVVLGLIFLKYISDAFEAKHAELDAQRAEGADVKAALEAVLGRPVDLVERCAVRNPYLKSEYRRLAGAGL
jgi:type I restriction-modification system DNA methylase subunit